MRIMHISSALTWRGGEQQIAYLIEGLSAQGIDSFVFCAAQSAMEDHCKKYNIPFSIYVKRSGVSFSAARSLAKKAKQQQVDLIHLHDAHAHTYGVMAATFFGCNQKMVLSRRVDFPIKSSFLTQLKYNHSSIQKIICVSKFIENLVRKSVKRPERVLTVYSGIDSSKFAKSKTGKLRDLLYMNNENVLIGNIAALAPHKDHFTFVDACEKILQKRPKIQFVIIGGDGGTKSSIEDYIDEKDLTDSIHLLGFRNDVSELIKDLDLFLFSSKTEGLGTSVIDAMAAELPIVTTAAGGIPEIIEHLKNGWLAKVGDAQMLAKGVLFALDHPKQSGEWTDVGKRKLTNFDKKLVASKTAEVYYSILPKA